MKETKFEKMTYSHLSKAFGKFCEKHRLTKFRLLLILLGAVALAVILEGFNSPHLSPFDSSAALDHPCSLAVSDAGSVIADTEHTRLIFLNQKQEVIRLVSLINAGSPVNWVNDCVIDGDFVYVLGAVKTNQGLYLESESIQIYSLSGSYERELYQITYDESSMVISPHFLTLWTEKGDCHVAGYENGRFYIQTVDGSGKVTAEKSYTCQTEPLFAEKIGNQVLVYGRDDRFYLTDETTGTMIAFTDVNDEAAWFDRYPVSAELSEKFSGQHSLYRFVLQQSADDLPQYVFCMTKDENTIYQYTFDDRQLTGISNIALSPWWTLKNFFFWAFVAYGAVMAAIGLYRVLIVKGKIWEWQRFLMLIFIAVLVTGVYSYYSYSRLKSTYTDEISVLGRQVTAEVKNGYGDLLADASEQGFSAYIQTDAGQERIAALEQFLSNMTTACGKEVGFFLNVQAVQQDGSTLMAADSQKAVGHGSFVQQSVSDFEGASSGIGEQSDVNGNYLVETSAVRDDAGRLTYIVEAGCFKGNLIKQLRTEAVNLLVSLVAVLITLWISYSVIRDIPVSIRDYKMKTAQGDPDAPVELSGLFTFIQQTITLIDAVILVYAVKSMVSDGSSLAMSSALIMAAFQFGMWLGNVLFFQLRIRIGEQKIGILASIGGFCAYGLMAFSVAANQLILMALGKFLSGVFVGSFLLILARGLPLGSKNTRTRSIGLNENQQAYTASAVLSALMAGYLSQYIAYTAVYLAGAVLCLPLIYLSLKAFKPGIDLAVRNQYFETKNRTKGLKGLIKGLPWMFYKTPAALSFVLLYTFPFVLSNGYATYLFPLYSAGAGISALLLSNITVFGQAIAYFTNQLVIEVTAEWQRLKKMIGYMVIICVCFLCFAFSPNIWWAIVVLFIQYILFRIPRVGTTVYLSELAESEGYHPRTVQPAYYSIEGIFNAAQAPVLKAFIPLGVNYACAGLGVFCSVLISIFAFLTGKRCRKEGLHDEQSI